MGNCCCYQFTRLREQTSRPKYRFIDGRRYHNVENSEYFIANDETEKARLQKINECAKGYWKANFIAPVHEKLLEPDAKVLDIGCGGGTWVLEMAKTYPTADFTGIDISLVFPTSGLPANAQFIEANMLDGLLWEDNTFTYVHQRYLTGGYTQEQWEKIVIPEIVRVLKPGGMLELCEASLILSEGPTVKRITQALSTIMISRGMYDNVGPHLKDFIECHFNLINITQAEVDCLIGERGGNAGIGTLKISVSGVAAGKPALVPILGVQEHEWENLMREFARELNEYNSFVVNYRVCAEKS